jgi:hypothetical protein
MALIKNENHFWKKSSRSVESDCVEACRTESVVLVRDSKDTSGPTLAFTEGAWTSFISSIRR